MEQSVGECFAVFLYFGCLPAAGLVCFALHNGHPVAPVLFWRLNTKCSCTDVPPVLLLFPHYHCSFFIPVLCAPAWCLTKSGITQYREPGKNVGLFMQRSLLFTYIYQQRQGIQKTKERNRTCPEPII